MATIQPQVYQRVGSEPGEPLPAFAWPGGYTLVYYDGEGNTLCAPCATDAESYSSDTIAVDTYDGGPTIQCDNCGVDLESSYGDPT